MYAKYRKKSERREKATSEKPMAATERERECAQREHATKNEKNGSAKRYSNAVYLSSSQPRKGRLYLNEWQAPTNAKNIIILLLFFGAGVVRTHILSFFRSFFLFLIFSLLSFRFDSLVLAQSSLSLLFT